MEVKTERQFSMTENDIWRVTLGFSKFIGNYVQLNYTVDEEEGETLVVNEWSFGSDEEHEGAKKLSFNWYKFLSNEIEQPLMDFLEKNYISILCDWNPENPESHLVDIEKIKELIKSETI